MDDLEWPQSRVWQLAGYLDWGVFTYLEAGLMSMSAWVTDTHFPTCSRLVQPSSCSEGVLRCTTTLWASAFITFANEPLIKQIKSKQMAKSWVKGSGEIDSMLWWQEHYFFFFKIYLFLFVRCCLAPLGLHCCAQAFSSFSEQGWLSSDSAQIFHCSGFFHCRALACSTWV